MKICCPRCRGEGKVELKTLSKPLRECYTLMAKLGPATRDQIHIASKSRKSRTMTFKRVVRLKNLGLVEPAPGDSDPVVFQVV